MNLLAGGPLRVLASWRPVRAVVYLVTSVILAEVTLVGLVVFTILSALVGMPLAALPVGAVERRRLALLGLPVPADPHRAPSRPGLRPWLALRYGEAATWRELAYAVLFAAVIGPLSAGPPVALAGLVVAAVIVPRDAGGGFHWFADIGFAALFALTLYVSVVFAAGQAALVRGLAGGESEAAVQDLTSSRARLVDAFEVERRRIERDLHDGAQQRLVALSMTLGTLGLALRDGPPEARQLAVRAGTEARDALSELRELVRGIHPQVLTDHGLAAAVVELADRSPLPTAVALPPGRLPATVESAAYFVVAEALTNAVKHAAATRVQVAGRVDRGRLVLTVTDDGRGGADPAAGTGLAGLADRVAALDGTLRLTSPLGGPTVLRLEVPCSA